MIVYGYVCGAENCEDILKTPLAHQKCHIAVNRDSFLSELELW